MKKKLIGMLVLLLLTLLTTSIFSSPKSYIRINPKIKIGKFENGNYFLDFVPAKFNWHINEYYSIAGGASVGFTKARSGIGSFNHFMNRICVRATYRPLTRLGFFFEANFSNLIEGYSSPVTYFCYGNYQAVGVEIDLIEFH